MASNSAKGKNVVEEYINIDEYSETGKGEDKIDEHKEAAKSEIEKVGELVQFEDESQLRFILDVGLVKNGVLGAPYRAQLRSDKWNLFLRPSFEENNLVGFLKEGEDVREGIQVNVYDKGGHEFETMLKKWEMGSDTFFVLNRGWFSFCHQQRLGGNDLIAIRTFRHAITDVLSFIVTYKRMRCED